MKTAAFWISGTLLGLVVLAALFATSGLYSVAASRGHFAVTSWLLEFGMRRSVATHSLLITAPPLDRPDMISLGAGHYHGGCAPCHGTPDEDSNPITDRMLPPPPPLNHAVTTWSDAELFWIVRNGIKYTGMPGWVALERDDEVWAMVAFLRRLPQIGKEDYRRLTRSARTEPDRNVREQARYGNGAYAISACVRCHGDEKLAPASRLIPVIAGQSAAYLEGALRQYADGSRKSGVMQPVAAELGSQAISSLAAYYASLPPINAGGGHQPPREQIERGQAIATLGVPAKGVPPCLACHAGSAATFPKLAGQHAAYIAGQLELWRRGLRGGTAQGAIMAAVAKRLSAQEADDVAAFFGSLGSGPAANHGAPAGAASVVRP